MEEFELIKSRVNLNRVNLGIALISDLKLYNRNLITSRTTNFSWYSDLKYQAILNLTSEC